MSTDYPTILSVIVPVYNVEKYLAECLDSILNQTLREIEILVIDDGSTDSSADIIRKYASRDKRIKAFFKENGGLSDARNYGLDRVTGKFVTFIDSDDVLLNNNVFAQILESFNERSNIDIVQYDVVYKWKSQYEHTRQYPVCEYHGVENILSGYLNENIHVSCCDKVFRAEIFKYIRFPKGEISEDIAIIPQIVSRINGIYVSDVGDYGYRYREDSISTSAPKPQKIYSILRSYNKYLSYCLEYESLKNKTIELYASLIWNYTAVMRRNHKESLKEYFAQPVFISLTLSDWFKHNGKSLQSAVKSFLVCVKGVKSTSIFQSLFTR